MADIELIKDSKEKSKVDSTCRECKRSTKHLIISDVLLKGSEDHFQWDDEYQIIQCQGCETISFRKTHQNSENYYQEYYQVGSEVVCESGYEEPHVDIYPNPEEERNPMRDYQLLPFDLQRIYTETIKSINSSLPILTGVGIRAIVETVCKSKNAKGKYLNRKINALVDQRVLTPDGADILHKLRILGNAAAHKVKPHDNIQLGLALDVIDHLLQGVYILPLHANTKFKSCTAGKGNSGVKSAKNIAQ